jgi:prepilin-type N-terminal cleavage/methylation domain-containing protein
MSNVSNTQKSKSQGGFSLVELLVVVVILGVLAAAGIISYTKYISGSQDTVQESNASAIANALKTAQIARNGGLTVSDTGCTTTAVSSTTSSTASATQMVGNCAQSLVNNGNFKSAYTKSGIPSSTALILPNSTNQTQSCVGTASSAGALVIVSNASGMYVAACAADGNYVNNKNTTNTPGTDFFQFMGPADTF